MCFCLARVIVIGTRDNLKALSSVQLHSPSDDIVCMTRMLYQILDVAGLPVQYLKEFTRKKGTQKFFKKKKKKRYQMCFDRFFYSDFSKTSIILQTHSFTLQTHTVYLTTVWSLINNLHEKSAGDDGQVRNNMMPAWAQ